MEIDKNALVISRAEINIAAPPDRVWEVFTNISAWPDWHDGIESATLDDPLAVGASFQWHTWGLDVTSMIGELIPHQRLVWSGLVRGIMAIHAWQFTAVDGGTLVQTEESWDGASVRPQADAFRQTLEESLHAWLLSLREAAETYVKPDSDDDVGLEGGNW